MTAFTPNLVTALQAQATWTYEQAAAFAAEHNLSTRQVISKVKHLELDYVPKAAKVAKTPQFRKSDIVRVIATSLDLDYDVIAGLAKADKAALEAIATKVA